MSGISKRLFSLKTPVLLPFTISWFVILLIPVVMGFSIYSIILGNSRDQLRANNMLMMENAVEDVERSLLSSDEISSTLHTMNSLRPFMEPLEDLAQAVVPLASLTRNLPELYDKNHLVYRYLIYSRENDIIITNATAFFQIPMYYNEYFAYNGLNCSQWMAYMFPISYRAEILPAADMRLGNFNGYSLAYRVPYIDYRRSCEAGQIVFFISEEALGQLFAPVFSTGASHVWLLDHTDTVIASIQWVDEAPVHDPEGTSLQNPHALNYLSAADYDMLLTEYTSSGHGLRCISATPKAAFHQQANEVLRVVTWVILIWLAIGILVTILLYSANRKPLTQILRRVSSSEALPQSGMSTAIKSGLWEIDRAIMQISDRNKRLQENIVTHRGLIRKILTQKLINAEPLTQEEIKSFLETLEIPWQDGQTIFRGIFAVFPASGSVLGSLLSTAEFDEALANSKRFVLMDIIGQDTLAMLEVFAPPDSGKHEDLLQPYKQVYNKVQSLYGLDVVFYLGSSGCAEQIPESFAQARKMLASEAAPGERFLIEYHQKEEQDEEHAYSPAQEQKLLNFVASGEAAEAEALLEQIYRENFVQRSLSPFMRDVLYYKLLGSAACSEYAVPFADTRLYHYCGALPPEEFFRVIKIHYNSMCAYTDDVKKQRNNQLLDDIQNYIRRHYQDSMLSLTVLAMRFHMTESYLSLFFKEKLGVNFSVYLEQLRIRRANELLESGEQSVTEIALSVGYTNANSFGRAYKRVVGYSPSRHKKAHPSDQ